MTAACAMLAGNGLPGRSAVPFSALQKRVSTRKDKVRG